MITYSYCQSVSLLSGGCTASSSPFFWVCKLFFKRNISLKHHFCYPQQKPNGDWCGASATVRWSPKVQELKCQRSMVQRATLLLHPPSAEFHQSLVGCLVHVCPFPKGRNPCFSWEERVISLHKKMPWNEGNFFTQLPFELRPSP